MAGDVRSAGGGWALRTICVLGAAAMAAVGVYLFEPGLADLGFYVERGKYALAGYTLIYAALLVGFAATAGVLRTGNGPTDYAFSFVAGPIALFALGLLFLALAVDAYLYRDPTNFWVSLLAIPAVLCFVATSLSTFAETQSVASSGDGRSGSRGMLAGLLKVTVYFVLSLAATVIYINAGYLLFYLLQANLLDGNDLDLTRIGSALIAVLREVIAERWLFVVIMGTLGSLLIYAIAGLVAWGTGGSQSGPQAYDPQDETFVERSAQQVRDYAAARGYDRDGLRLLWLVVLPSMFAPMVVALIVGVNLHNWFPRPYEAAQLEALGWFVYERSVGLSVAVMVFAALLWGALPNAVISRLWRTYSEAVGWSGFTTQQVSLETYLRQFLRSGFLSRERPFEPGAFLHRINTMYEPYFLFSATAATFVAAIMWHHDLSRYYVLTDRYAEVMSYWTLERRRVPYASAHEVAIGCEYEDGRPRLSFAIRLPGGFEVDFLARQAVDDRLADLFRLDEAIPPSVPRVFSVVQPFLQPARSGFDAVCIEELAAGLPEADGDRLRQVTRVEVWHRQRWRERIGTKKLAL